MYYARQQCLRPRSSTLAINPRIGVGVRGDHPSWQWAALVILLLLAGCVSSVNEIDPQQAAIIEIGKSTKADVLATLGLPHNREMQTQAAGDSVECWIYYRSQWRSTVLVTIAAPSYPPGTGGGGVTFPAARRQSDTEAPVIRVLFDAAGVVTEVKTKEGQ
jgi:outer membrane protein assembly factor BamE (lipoprotein component of BamABCDE complex)